MITRQTKLQLLVFGILAIAGLAFAGGRYAGLAKYFVDEGYDVSADFADSGGVFKGSEVTYRGVPVGKVTELQLVPNGVRAVMQLENDVHVPTGAKALVANRSAVGEQYIDLQPQREGAPYLKEGAVIPFGQTEIPIQPTQLLLNLDRFVNSVDTKDVGVVLEQLGNAFEGRGDDLQRLVDAGDLLTRAASDNLPQTLQLIRDGQTVLDTQRDTSSQFRSFNRDLRTLTDQLRASDPDFRSLFANGAQSAVNTTDLIEANRTDLPILINNLVTVAQVQKVRLDALRQILVTYPNVVAGGFTVAPGDGTAHFGSASTTEPGVCGTATQPGVSTPDPSGYETTIAPFDFVGATTPDLSAGCKNPPSPDVDVRGARNAPPRDGARAGSSGGSAASRTNASGDTTTVGDYDPSTGRAITADGRTLTIGSTAGAAQVFGDSSWQWMLAGPLAHK